MIQLKVVLTQGHDIQEMIRTVIKQMGSKLTRDSWGFQHNTEYPFLKCERCITVLPFS